jgi:hypothetical protein
MADLIKGNDAIGQSAKFAPWSVEAEGYLDLTSAEWQTFGVLRSSGAMKTNFSQVIGVTITPGQMGPARESLGTLADHYESVYKRPVDILSLEGGLHYRHFMVIGYDSMEQYDEDQTTIATGKAYAQWSVDMMGKFDNPSIERSIGRWF